ncbi:MAG: TetR/AcrR family transcriptional regulator [Acidimicrobiales bacterium]
MHPTTPDTLLDAVERVLVAEGPSAISTRRIAEEAGQSHGLIRYHFGTLEQLMVRTLERAGERILDRQRALYATDQPFIEKWRTAMSYLDQDVQADSFPKLAAELLALSWNDPAYRPAMQSMVDGFTAMLEDAVRAGLDDYEVSPPDVEAIATLIRTFQLGILLERLAGVETGHRPLLAVIDSWLEALPRRSA